MINLDLPPPVQEPFCIEAMGYILDELHQGRLHNTYYEDLVGLSPDKMYGTEWDHEELSDAKQALAFFGRRILSATGREYRDNLEDPKSFRQLILDWAAMPHGNNSSVLQYQGSGKNPTIDSRISSFLEFGVPQTPRDGFDNGVRVYVDAPQWTLPLFASVVVSGYADELKTTPYLKFRESTTDTRYKDRSDGLVVYTSSPDELMVTLRAIKTLHDSNPGPLSTRKGIILGETVTFDGIRVPAVRFGQEPDVSGESFNTLRVGVLQMLGQEFKGRQDEPFIVQKMNDYYSKVIASNFDLNPNTVAFNDGQDIGVIRAAVAAI